MTTTLPAPPDAAALRAAVAELLQLPADGIGEDDDLFTLGLDSLGLIRLATGWRRAGLRVTFEELANDPTLRHWQTVLGSAAACPEAPQFRQNRGQPSPPAPGFGETGPGSAPQSRSSGETGVEEPAFPLATMQYAYWVGRQEGQPFGGVAAHFYAELDGTGVDPERLQAAVRALVARHDMLRVRFDDDGRQRIADTGHADVTVHDLRSLPADELDRRLTGLREHYTHQRMDVAAGRVFEVALSLLPDDATRLHVDLDMLAADALSMRILLADLRRLYQYPAEPLTPVDYSYRRYLRDRADQRNPEADAAWWRERDLPAAPALPTRPDAGRTPARTARLHHHLDPAAKQRLFTRAAAHGVTPAAALATAFAEAIAAWSDDQRFLLNLPLFAREPLHPGVDRLVGDFSSSVLLDVDARQSTPFADRARTIQTGLHQAIGHGSYSGVEVLRDLSRTSERPVLAPVVYTSAIGLGEIYDRPLRECFGEPSWIISQGPQVWLDAQVTELSDGLLLNWDVREDILADGVATAAFAAYRSLVDALVETASDDAWRRPVGGLLPAAQAAVRAAVNDTARDQPAGLLHDGLFRHAWADPDRPALVTDREALSYGELAERALRVAGALTAAGVRPGDAVIVTLPKGLDQAVAALGVLTAGAAYLPVGVDQPAMRRARIHRRAKAAAALTDAAHAPAVRGAGHALVLKLSTALAHPPAVAPVRPAPDSLAYILFTSGSTGEPKGVEVSHAAAMNTITGLNERYAVGADDRSLTVSALEFDLSVYDLFGPITAGGAAVVVAEEHRRDPDAWWRAVIRHRVTVWNTVPALLDLLLTAGAQAGDDRAPLRLVLLGGDWVGLDLPARLRTAAPAARFVALGGMTEAAIHSTVQEVGRVPDDWRSVPWGQPLPNVRCRVVDARGDDRPDWVAGELWVSGAGLARGYRGDPGLTRDRFVEHGGARWYRSGDGARYWPDGTLEFLGRIDHQVKVRGHRIELGEVEAALRAHPAVAEAVVTVVTGAAPRLAAAVTPRPPENPDPAALRDWLADRLPPHMCCEQIELLPALPLTGNGKRDRAAVTRLLTDAAAATPIGSEPPEGEVEPVVADIWAELLGITTPVGRGDSFFTLGGDSLLATQLIGRLRAVGLTGARLAALFADPRLSAFAATLTRGEVTADQRISADHEHRYEPFPLTDVQQAYRTGRDPRLPLGGVGTWQYAEFDGAELDLERLERAWRRLIDRHEMLRVIFDDDGQRILPAAPPWQIDVRTAEADPDTALTALRTEKSQLRLDLSRWPLFDVTALHYRWDGQHRTRLAIGLDYLSFDALSIMTLFTELDLLYREPEAELPPIEVSFRDYVQQVRPEPAAVEADQAYWRERVAQLPPAPQLPAATRPERVTAPEFTRRQRWLPAARWRALRERARAHGLTPSTVLLAAYAEVLGRWSTQPELTVTLTLFNRREVHEHIYRVLGDFTTLSLADYRPAPDEPWLAAAARLQQQLGTDLDHRDVSPAWLLRELARATGSLEAMPVVFTSAIGVGQGPDRDVSMDMSGGFPERVFGISQSPQVSLDNQVLESAGGLLVTWDAVDELFRPGVLDAMFDAYLELLDRLSETEWSEPLPELLPAAQRQQRARVNDTAADLPPRRLHDAVFAAAARRPERTALRFGGGTMSYGELAERSLRVAGALVARGVTRGDPVAVTLPKGPDQVVAALGVLAAGGGYVPVGVEQPRLRRDRIYADAGVRLVIGDGDTSTLDPETARTADPLPAPVVGSPDDLAYVIFTSGSTGAPKGVELSHAAAANTVADIVARYGIGADDRVLGLSALDFDLSVFDLFGLLGVGGEVILPAEDERRDAPRWLELVREHRVTVWNTVPTLLEMLLVAAGPEGLPASLRLALVSGDWVGLDLPGRLAAATADRCRLVALGGATEAAIWSNAYDVTEVPAHWRSVPYGFPLANQAYRVVDGAGRDRPDWVPGELWIGGAGLARGYRGDPGRTAEKFVTDQTGRWYRTGDLGRYWPDGTLEFLGRADHQVKLGGHRLELGEVESALESHPDCARAVVLAPGDRQRRSLHAVVEPAPAAEAEGLLHRLREHLREQLPGYAVPARFTATDALPLTGNGKVDRAAVAALVADAPEPGRPPQGPVEAALAELWAELLGAPVVDREANFFTVGGDSLLALRLVGAVRERSGVDVAVRDFLATPTLAGLAGQLDSWDPTEFESGVL